MYNDKDDTKINATQPTKASRANILRDLVRCFFRLHIIFNLEIVESSVVFSDKSLKCFDFPDNFESLCIVFCILKICKIGGKLYKGFFFTYGHLLVKSMQIPTYLYPL